MRIYTNRYKRKLSNSDLAELFQRWVNDPKPSEYFYGNEYGVHPRTIWRWVSLMYYGKVKNGIVVVKQSKINDDKLIAA